MSRRDPSNNDHVVAALRRVGLRVVGEAGAAAGDLVASHHDRALAIKLEKVGAVRIEDLKGRLALGILQLRKLSLRGAMPMVVVLGDRFGEKARRAAARFMSDHAPEMGWGFVDRAGGVHIEIPVWGLSLEVLPAEEPVRPRKTSTHLFSDLNRWMLKILLLGPDNEAHFGGPRLVRSVPNPTELHRIARVSVEKAHRFVRTFEEAGFLQRSRRGLQVVDREGLLDRWFEDERVRPTPRVPMRSVFGGDFSVRELAQRLGSRDYALGGFFAAARLSVLHADREGIQLHLRGKMVAAREDLDLVECSRRDAQLLLVGTRSVESVLRAATVRDGVRVVDEIQAALDVVDDPARGHEQARYIEERLLSRWGRS